MKQAHSHSLNKRQRRVVGGDCSCGGRETHLPDPATRPITAEQLINDADAITDLARALGTARQPTQSDGPPSVSSPRPPSRQPRSTRLSSLPYASRTVAAIPSAKNWKTWSSASPASPSPWRPWRTAPSPDRLPRSPRQPLCWIVPGAVSVQEVSPRPSRTTVALGLCIFHGDHNCRLPGERDHFRAGFAMSMGPRVCH